MARAADDAEHYQEARRRFVAANAIQSSNPRALQGFYRTYALSDDILTDNASLALEAAYAEASYDPSLRSTLAHWLLTHDRDAEAYMVMLPVINDPHSSAGQTLKKLFASQSAEDRVKLVDKLMPRPYGYEPPEDEDEDS